MFYSIFENIRAVQLMCCTNASSDRQEVVDPQLQPNGLPKAQMQKEEVVSAVWANTQPGLNTSSADTFKTPLQSPKNYQDTTREFTVEVVKTPESKLGVDVDHQDGLTLFVDQVTDGIIRAWNQQNPEQQVQHGDRIIEINGLRGDVHKLIDECKKSQTLVMKVRKRS